MSGVCAAGEAPERSAGEMAALVREFAPLVRSLARRYEGRGAEREDLEQEGYMALLHLSRTCSRKQMARRLSRHLPGYVRDAAARLRRSSWSAAPARVRADRWDDDGGDAPEELVPDARPAQEVAMFEADDALSSLLSDEDRTIITALSGGATQAEAAHALGISQQAVAHRLARIRRTLAGRL